MAPTHGPLIVQSDYTVLIEVEHPDYIASRDFLAGFTELVKSPDFIHTYRITPLSLWNAAALDISLASIIEGLNRFCRYDIPPNVLTMIREWYGAYGQLILERGVENELRLTVTDPFILETITNDSALGAYWLRREGASLFIDRNERGTVKHALVKRGYPVKDLCGYVTGEPFEICLREVDADGEPFTLRDYQSEAVEVFYQGGSKTGGCGVIVLPCGSGKTIIGLGIMAKLSTSVLIISTNNVAVHQWRDEIIAKTHVHADSIGEYTGLCKNIRAITITTYQMLTHRRSKEDPFHHLELFSKRNWGLIIYDEVHLLPAPVFRATTQIQAKRRLGLTATLVREDGLEGDVFALIGPKRYDIPWKTLENRGYIAEAFCTEYRVGLAADTKRDYAYAPKRRKFRIAAENPTKLALVRELIDNHRHDSILVIGQYIAQVEMFAEELGAPLIMGRTKEEKREELYHAFKRGTINLLVVSKVANFAVDLPDANVMIQVSGTFGSRQEEAQRLGRLLRPKHYPSYFYTLVSKGTVEQKFGTKRQLYLVEQGYKYRIKYY